MPIEQGTRIRKPALNELIGSPGILGSAKETAKGGPKIPVLPQLYEEGHAGDSKENAKHQG